MALSPLLFIKALLFALALSATVESSTSQLLKGKVSCLDCKRDQHFSGIKLQVKCDQVKKLAMASTKEDGSFQVTLPTDNSKTQTQTPRNCQAKLLGGPVQLYANTKNTVSKIVQAKTSNLYTISTPLTFSVSCPKDAKCTAGDTSMSSKTVNLPVPPEWGLAPTSYYMPFVPIIGVP